LTCKIPGLATSAPRSKARCSPIGYRTFPPATNIEVWAPSIYQTRCNAVPLRQPFPHIAAPCQHVGHHVLLRQPRPAHSHDAPLRKTEPTNVASHTTIDDTVANADTCSTSACNHCWWRQPYCGLVDVLRSTVGAAGRGKRGIAVRM